MFSRSLAMALLAGGCLTAAAGGSYLALRHNATEAAAQAAPAPVPEPAGTAAPVTETEAVVPAPVEVDDPKPVVEPAPTIRRREPRHEEPRPATRQAARGASVEPGPSVRAETTTATATPALPVIPEPDPVPLPPAVAPAPAFVPEPVEPLFTEITVPASAVIGLEIETTVTSEKAMIEDRVDARVTRDVYAEGRLVIPSGSRVIGAVTLVEKGGKIKDRSRLGVRFHTLVLADGRRLPLRTEMILREGESPGAESSRKIGGAAIGGAVLGAILGGGKGAVTGATVGAAGGTAAVMAGGRNAATLAGGTVVTVRLADPVTVEVGR